MHEKISVIVPVYNLEKELPRCMESILSQTYKNIEVVAVDDGSKDGSRQVIEGFAARDSRVKAVFKENGGVTSARLRGIEEATGEWIGFVDGDDEIEGVSCHCTCNWYSGSGIGSIPECADQGSGGYSSTWSFCTIRSFPTCLLTRPHC